MHTPGPTIYDTEWRAVLMGSEGWAVFAGPRMIASNLSESNARLIAASPVLLHACQEFRRMYRSDEYDDMGTLLDDIDNLTRKAIAEAAA